uniref:Uncharacterized protein n=3 Tax=Cuerna arida TaxID=1464854 RepID=A0A1B6FN10_9HEMI
MIYSNQDYFNSPSFQGYNIERIPQPRDSVGSSSSTSNFVTPLHPIPYGHPQSSLPNNSQQQFPSYNSVYSDQYQKSTVSSQKHSLEPPIQSESLTNLQSKHEDSHGPQTTSEPSSLPFLTRSTGSNSSENQRNPSSSFAERRETTLKAPRPKSEVFSEKKLFESSARFAFLNKSLENFKTETKDIFESTNSREYTMTRVSETSTVEKQNQTAATPTTPPPPVNYSTLPSPHLSSPSWMEIFESTPPLLEGYGLHSTTVTNHQSGQPVPAAPPAAPPAPPPAAPLPAPPTNTNTASVSDKKKFFEKAMEESHHPSPKPERVFAFLSQDEVEKMKQEEDKKIASLSRTELKTWGHHTDEEDVAMELESDKRSSVPSPTDTLVSMGSIRTAKAERRMKERLLQEGLLSDEEDTDLSPAEQRALRAEKRAAWRQARLKSLEQDALQAQMVIKKMSEMIGGRTVEEPADNNNQPTTDHQNNISEVETTREKIISLELSTPERGEGEGGEESEHSATSPTSPLPPSDEATTKRRRRKKSKKSNQ